MLALLMLAFDATTFGPIIGPIISGFIAVVSWRWIFWLSLIIAGATWPILLLSPETYAPVILASRARRLRKENSNPNIFAPLELEHRDMKQMITVVLTRPVRMFFTEAIVLCSCLYLSVGLTFLPIGVGAIFACGLYLYWDRVLERAKARDPPAAWSQSEEYRRLPLACLGGPLLMLSCFWLGWTAREDIHWAVPVLSALPFGMGFLLLFMSLVKYHASVLHCFAASLADVAAAILSMRMNKRHGSIGLFKELVWRSLAVRGATDRLWQQSHVKVENLPKNMLTSIDRYERLGVAWACSLLGFLSLAMCAIPFAFIRFGDSIREKSSFCQSLKQLKMQEEEEREVQERRMQQSGVGKATAVEKLV
ncbi:MFS general substrate transporter [Aureobasidium sp. EXF-10727]|nr:MFS general substrate transporter [Aureobasidium sp. EXF-10727]